MLEIIVKPLNSKHFWSFDIFGGSWANPLERIHFQTMHPETIGQYDLIFTGFD